MVMPFRLASREGRRVQTQGFAEIRSSSMGLRYPDDLFK
jgi:hypothetical protein